MTISLFGFTIILTSCYRLDLLVNYRKGYIDGLVQATEIFAKARITQ